MTAVSALLLALITGWLVPAPRLAMAAFLGPWLIALIYQTADIGLGYAVSPPQTVTQFPRMAGYVVVTAVILALGLILSALIGERRSRVVPVTGRRTAREMAKRATLAGTVVSRHSSPTRPISRASRLRPVHLGLRQLAYGSGRAERAVVGFGLLSGSAGAAGGWLDAGCGAAAGLL